MKKYSTITLYQKQENKQWVKVVYNPSTENIYVNSRYIKKRVPSKQETQTLKQRQKILNKIKMGMGCAICGYNKYPEALDFHHVNSENKTFTIQASRMTRRDFLDEMQKCMCLCSNCHRHITQVEKEVEKYENKI